MNEFIATYLRYGVPNGWALEFERKGLSASTFKNTSIKNLTERYGIDLDKAKQVKNYLKRTSIEKAVVQQLLDNNNYTCCLCKGKKGDSFIIHHIEEYSVSQNNNYDNLAVLCPNDHDLAHKTGKSLTARITSENIRESKRKWELQCQTHNVQTAALKGDIHEIDFINFERILELYDNTIGGTPISSHTESLVELGLINSNGHLVTSRLADVNSNLNYPLKFFGPNGAWLLRMHFKDIFIQCISKLNFIELDTLLNKNSILNGSVQGRYCYYIGGVYGKRPTENNLDSNGLTHLHFRRRPFYVEWKVDPKYMLSLTALSRLSKRTIYIIYGVVRNVDHIEIEGKKKIHIDIRPYMFGMPNVKRDRRPNIHFTKNKLEFEEYFAEIYTEIGPDSSTVDMKLPF